MVARSVSFGMAVELDLDGNVAGGAPGLFRVNDAGGQPNVTAVAITGSAVTLTLDRALVLPATVSYGWSIDPAAPARSKPNTASQCRGAASAYGRQAAAGWASRSATMARTRGFQPMPMWLLSISMFSLACAGSAAASRHVCQATMPSLRL